MGQKSLYVKEFEKDACGIGFVAQLKGSPSYEVVDKALSMLCCMEHRGAVGAEKNSGDGAGVLIQIPHELLQHECSLIGISLPEAGVYGVGNIFLPPEVGQQGVIKEFYRRAIEEFDQVCLGFREVPVNPDVMGGSAFRSRPSIWQVFVGRRSCLSDIEFERKLYLIRKYMDHLLAKLSVSGSDFFYTCSLSCKKIVYKGQLTTDQVQKFYLDLQNPLLKSCLAMVHSRFSTNTFPSWSRSQPFRFLSHNGEINTLRGNKNSMLARNLLVDSGVFDSEDLKKILPIVEEEGSDSATLDNVVELLALGGRSLPHVMMMLIPEAWDKNDLMDQKRRAFYEYHATLMEPWDGPASIAFTDGDMVGATLDRNGLRPSRYCLTESGLLIMSSEQGALEVEEQEIVLKGRLQSGRMFWADLKQGCIISDDELKGEICSRYPYEKWVQSSKVSFDQLPSMLSSSLSSSSSSDLACLKKVFGYTKEDMTVIIRPMVEEAKEPIGSMGSDTPLAILSNFSQNLFNYFHQLFAQVTNPPIDPIREQFVMSLRSYCGEQVPILSLEPCRPYPYLSLDRPFLTNFDLQSILNVPSSSGLKVSQFSILVRQEDRFDQKLEDLCESVRQAVLSGQNVIVLSDRGVESQTVALPSLLAISAVHHTLVDHHIRSQCGLIIETGEAREIHHFATLLGYGATAVNPYLALDIIDELVAQKCFDFSCEEAQDRYFQALDKGLLKVMSKMGISTVQSYLGAQIFEPVGLSQDFIDRYFSGSYSRLDGVDLSVIEKETRLRHQYAYSVVKEDQELEPGGHYAYRRRGEQHLLDPLKIHLLQRAAQSDDFDLYKQFSNQIGQQDDVPLTLRSLLDFDCSNSIDLSEVEPVENILKRFATGAMSLGSISRESHETLAIAMNRIGAKSNTGEGGEDPVRFTPDVNGDNRCSAIKQVASGRFGVTSYYLSKAKEIQIKMAQGAKPGEGGQLPGTKVDQYIARLRHSTPGVGLISPPPHHDIYSIEDLAQLIYDLKNANEMARINVKLVSEIGVGMVASGVAKAHADVVLISGADGGTGASPLTSLKHAGLPWELGLAEVHQTLVLNGLRSRIVLQTDGQIRTGRDIVVATLLGAEEWGVATSALVTIGCIMMRKCHLNTCPVGIATQDKELRTLFTGRPDYVVNYFRFLAMEVREIMARLGFSTIDSMVGRVDKLKAGSTSHWKARYLDFSPLIQFRPELAQCQETEQDHGLESILDRQFIQVASDFLDFKAHSVRSSFRVKNTDRSVGTMLSYRVSKAFEDQPLSEDSLYFDLKGNCGQSFSAFGVKGLTFHLKGSANDYFGKGLCGAKLILEPEKGVQFKADENVIVGNVAFYGATSGQAYIEGLAGERFCVRNSGVEVVVEGVGDNACEYMTGGRVVILGDIGRNFAAGMSGGIAYIWDPSSSMLPCINQEMVEIQHLEEALEIEFVLRKIREHTRLTGSQRAFSILESWDRCVGEFIKIMPLDYKRVLEELAKQQTAG